MTVSSANQSAPIQPNKPTWTAGVTPTRTSRETRVNNLISKGVLPSNSTTAPKKINAAPTTNDKVAYNPKTLTIIGKSRSEEFAKLLEAMEKDESVTFQDVRDLIDEANSGDKDHFEKVIKEAYVTFVQSKAVDKKEKEKEEEVQPQSRTTAREKERKTNTSKSSTDTFIESEVRRNVEAQTIDAARENRKTHEKKMAKRDDEIREANKKASEKNIDKIDSDHEKRKT